MHITQHHTKEVTCMNIDRKYYKWIWTFVFLAAAVLCFTLFYKVYDSSAYLKGAVKYLDDKANTVLALTGASTSASVAITMIPGDIGTPIADKLADISSYSILILAAVHLEKYLITIAGSVVLKTLLPAAFIAAAINMATYRNESVFALIKKVFVLAAALMMVVPSSVYISRTIENTYKEDKKYNIEETQKEADEIKESLQTQDQTLWDKFLTTVTGGTTEIINKFEGSLNNFIEAMSVMLITACVIPLLTFIILLWLIQNVLQIDFNIPFVSDLAKHTRINPHKITGR